MIDLHPAADRLRRVLADVADEDLTRPTPCPGSSVGDLVDHIGTLAVAFAQKAGSGSDAPGVGGPPPRPDAARLEPAWRDRIDRDLDALAAAWDDPQAWEGMTTAGGIEMPSEVAALVALDEMVIHGWDVAVATGQAYDVSDPDVDAATQFVAGFEAPRDGTLFGPEVAVAADAPPFDRLLGLTGRDPAWRPT